MALHDLDDARLETALRETGRTLPGAHRDLGAQVVASLRSRQHGRRPRRRLALGLATLAVLLAGAAAAGLVVPGVGLRVDGTRAPRSDRALVTDAAFLGERTTLAAARGRVDFPVRVPPQRDLGPAQVYVAAGATGHRVSLLYGAGARVPAMDGTDVGLLLTQFRGTLDSDLLTKTAHAETQITPVDVGGTRGWWVQGAHEVRYVAPDGSAAHDRARFADSTLLWTRDGVTLRLESALPRREAVAIAASLAD